MEFNHIPVLLNEIIYGLKIKKDGIYVDGTLGGAGHTAGILKEMSGKGILIGIDRDDEALLYSKQKLNKNKNVIYVKNNHDNIKEIISDLDIDKVDGILLDLGVSSYQIDNQDRGFSYISDSDLDMRMDKSEKKTAQDIVNEYSEKELETIFYKYGEERFSKKIAQNIIIQRNDKRIETTSELNKIIEESIPTKYRKSFGHPSKRVFQALRIEVNGELISLYNTILDSIQLLKTGGRLCVITFHSLEDRIVKNAYKEAEGFCKCPTDFPKCVCNYTSLGKIITKKPIVESLIEQEKNSRSKSAKLRIFEKN